MDNSSQNKIRSNKVNSMSYDKKILGPPGCGKTTRLLEYLQREIESGTPPERIAFLTFTRAARLEALQRTSQTEKTIPYLKTIHSICYHQLAVGKDQIVRPEDLRSFGLRLGIKMTGAELDPWIEEFERTSEMPTSADVLLQINHKGRHLKKQLKDSLIDAPQDIDYKFAKWFTQAYHKWKETYGKLDYTDLLIEYKQYGKPLDIDVLIIDEAQDLSPLQWDVVNVLGANRKRGYFAGDDDQAIFNWAGADSSVFQNLEADEVEVLDQSHRVSKAVYNEAMKIAARIKTRLKKEYKPTESEGKVTNEGFLGNMNFDEKSYILFRNHYRGNEIGSMLRNSYTPYIGKGSPLRSVDVRVAVLAWYQLLAKGEAPTEHIKKMIKYCDEDWLAPGIFTKVKEHQKLTKDQVFLEVPASLGKWPVVLNNIPIKDVLANMIRRYGFVKTALPRVELLSIHQSKGRESHTIIIDTEMSRAVWQNYMTNPDDEHRVWYVAVTRAKENVRTLFADSVWNYRF